MSYWESQPEVYTAEGEPCFVFTLVWDDFRIRSLHPPDSDTDKRADKVREQEEQRLEEEQDWLKMLKFERWELSGFDFGNPYADELNFDDFDDDWNIDEA